jgi:hypothetical protein
MAGSSARARKPLWQFVEVANTGRAADARHRAKQIRDHSAGMASYTIKQQRLPTASDHSVRDLRDFQDRVHIDRHAYELSRSRQVLQKIR